MNPFEVLVREAAARGITICTAESCTAGLIAASLADIPGASSVLRGGAVTYCDEIKRDVLGVKAETLAAYTAVSEQTAREMADRSRELFCATMSVSATGYAGPGGGTEADPAGTVYIATCDDGGVFVHRCSFAGSRNDVRRQACEFAANRLLERVRLL
ncbi:MAG: CinA family protein [Coriobacteriaceae bacterium]|nr:CinA family protein [Coriobacteriaceae bacterium]